MSTALEAASLVMVPSGYEDGTLASVKPTDGTGDFTFSRGSDISATRVNADGYIEKGYENLLLQSNSFTTSPWNIVGSHYNLTSGQVGYDGSNDAWLLEKTTTSNYYFGQSVVSVGSVYTVSLRAKADSANSGILLFFGTPFLKVDLEAKNVYSRRNSIFDSVTDIGNGWVEIVFTFVASSTSTNFQLTSNNSTGQTGSIYIQDFQINQGLVAYPYKETTTAPVAGGILEDMPRLDYSSCPALLLEPSRTNVLEHSEYISSATFSFSNISFDYNSASSPEGKTNATKLIVTSGGGNTRLFKQTSGSGSQVVSVFAKAGEKNAISVSSYTGTGYLYAMYNLTNGTLINSIADDTGIEDMGNGWYRVWVYVANSTNRYAHLSIGDSTDSPAYTLSATGNGSDGLYIYGFQAEQDATYPTSYIPTYGVSQTRLADECGGAGNASTFNSTEGVLYGEISKPTTNLTTFSLISLNNAASNNDDNSVTIGFDNGSDFYFRIKANAVNILVSTNVNANANEFHKVALKYRSRDIKFFINGVEVASSTSTFSFSAVLDNLSFDFNGNGTLPFYGNAKQLFVFPTALTDSECIELTTI